jgi:hypothetical protein
MLLLWLGNPALTAGALNALTVVGVVVVAIILYLLVTILAGRRVIARLNPWVGALLLDSPVLLVFIPGVPGVPGFLRLGLLEYFAVSLVCQGLCGYGGCEVLAFPNMFLGTRYNVACVVFSPIDWLESKLRRILSRKNV